MATEFERKESADGLTFKIYRGEGVALLAFDLDPDQATDDFVGFSVEVQYPDSDRWGALKNRLHFDYPPNVVRPRSFRSTEAPFQKFRWIHVPTEVKEGEFRYRVTARYMDAAGVLNAGATSRKCNIAGAADDQWIYEYRLYAWVCIITSLR